MADQVEKQCGAARHKGAQCNKPTGSLVEAQGVVHGNATGKEGLGGGGMRDLHQYGGHG
jgi:hypothetical protein